MNKYMTLGLTAILLSLALAAEASPELAPSSDAGSNRMPCQGVLVLHGGQVFQGKITRSGDLYHVVLPQGEIRLRANRVAYQCDTLEEAYCRRRATIRIGSAEAHIELARWCQHNGLFEAAGRELADATAADPTNPLIPHLKRGLIAALRPVALPVEVDEKDETSPLGPTAQDLDRMVRQMPPDAVAVFTSSIQPVLLSSCTNGGCHGPQSGSQFQLLRGRAGGPPTRRVTQRNLHATLEWINREQPQESPLLTEAIRVHGSAKAPAFTDKDVMKYRQMVQWVYSISQVDASTTPGPKTIDLQGLTEARAMATGPVEKPQRPNPSAAAEKPSAVSPESLQPSPFDRPPAPDEPAQMSAHPNTRRGAPIEQFVPTDPFDPEIFNRRYHVGEQK